MTSKISCFLHPYAQQLALHALQRIDGARLKFILQYKNPAEVIQVGDIDGSESEQSDSTVVLLVRSPNLWMRICSCLDLVRLSWLDLYVNMALLMECIRTNRGFQRPICFRKLTVMIWVKYLMCVHPWLNMGHSSHPKSPFQIN